jgi:hypothetical protein
MGSHADQGRQHGLPPIFTRSTAPTSGKKVFLRRIPADPMTGNTDWASAPTRTTPTRLFGGQNVFDVHTKSTGTAPHGTNVLLGKHFSNRKTRDPLPRSLPLSLLKGAGFSRGVLFPTPVPPSSKASPSSNS